MESDIAPYKGLLMGLFFMSVGMEISVQLFLLKWKEVLAAIVVLIAGKVRPLRNGVEHRNGCVRALCSSDDNTIETIPTAWRLTALYGPYEAGTGRTHS